MFKVEIQPDVISKYLIFMRHISATDIEIIVLEELRFAFYNAEAGLFNFPPLK